MKPNKIYNYLLLCVFICLSCQNKQIKISLENTSKVSDSINIDIELDNKLLKNVWVKKGKETITYEKLNIDYPSNKTEVQLNFKLKSTGETTGIIVKRDSITQYALVNVNFIEIVFFKGFKLGTRVLDKDSLVKREFYSDVFY